jgi:hypothetical protein
MHDLAQWFRLLIFVLIIFSFLRRAFKARTQGSAPPTLRRPPQGRKNDFRDVPPPPENPHLG